jgi:hypothetical protein
MRRLNRYTRRPVASGYRGGIRTRLNYATLPSRNLEVTPKPHQFA